MTASDPNQPDAGGSLLDELAVIVDPSVKGWEEAIEAECIGSSFEPEPAPAEPSAPIGLANAVSDEHPGYSTGSADPDDVFAALFQANQPEQPAAESGPPPDPIEPADDSEAQSGPAATLEALDESLAGDVDALLEGTIDTAEDILGSTELVEIDSLDGEIENPFPTATDDPEDELADEPASIDELAAPPTPEPTAAVDEEPALPPPFEGMDMGSEPLVEPTPVPPPSPPEAVDEPEVELAPVVEVIKPPVKWMAFLLMVLTLLNAPLNFIPSNLRFLVDVFAITLVFWVPIVWAFAFFVL